MIYGDKNVQVEVGAYCRWYRMFKVEATLRSMLGEDHVKTLSAFEHGRSTNMLLLLEYIRLAEDNGELVEFMDGLVETVIKNEWRDDVIYGYTRGEELE